MRIRNCFRCGKEIDYESYIKNINSKDIDYMARIWNSKHVELYCCHCYCIKIKYQSPIDSDWD